MENNELKLSPENEIKSPSSTHALVNGKAKYCRLFIRKRDHDKEIHMLEELPPTIERGGITYHLVLAKETRNTWIISYVPNNEEIEPIEMKEAAALPTALETMHRWLVARRFSCNMFRTL